MFQPRRQIGLGRDQVDVDFMIFFCIDATRGAGTSCYLRLFPDPMLEAPVFVTFCFFVLGLNPGKNHRPHVAVRQFKGWPQR